MNVVDGVEEGGLLYVVGQGIDEFTGTDHQVFTRLKGLTRLGEARETVVVPGITITQLEQETLQADDLV